MVNLYILLIIFLSYSFVSYLLSGGKLLSPSVIFSISFTISILFGYIWGKYMFVNDIEKETLSMMTFAGMVFIFSEFIIRIATWSVYNGKTKGEIKHNLLVDSSKLRFLTIFAIISVVISIINIYLSATSGSFFNRMNQLSIFLHRNESLVFAPKLTYELLRVWQAIMYVVGYDFAIKLYNDKNYCKTVLFRKTLRLILLYFVFVLLCTQRYPAVYIVIFIAIAFSLQTYINKDRKIGIVGYLLRGLPILFAFAIIFYYLAVFVGRSGQNLVNSAMEYFTLYSSSGIASINTRIVKQIRSEFWGQKTFSGYYIWLSRLGLAPASSIRNRWDDFERYGNTYTIFGNWYMDFGKTGVIVASVILSIILSKLFYSIIYGKNKSEMAQIYICMFLSSLVFAGYDDHISKLMHPSNLINMIIIYFVYVLLSKRIVVRI